jgi:hypothetical protein
MAGQSGLEIGKGEQRHGRKVRHDAHARKPYITAMIARLVLVLGLAALLAACGACEGRINNSGTTGGRCTVLSMPW